MQGHIDMYSPGMKEQGNAVRATALPPMILQAAIKVWKLAGQGLKAFVLGFFSASCCP